MLRKFLGGVEGRCELVVLLGSQPPQNETRMQAKSPFVLGRIGSTPVNDLTAVKRQSQLA